MYSIRILVSILCLALAQQVSDAQERVALLVGIGDYGKPNNILPQLQAGTGIRIMERTLLNQGFTKENILILQDHAATKEAIESAFHSHLARAGTGGVAFFHFYGHGDRIKDDNGDETDGIDEVFLTFSASKVADEAEKTFIRDDELGHWVRKLQEEIGEGGQVVTLLDACHSGSGLRGEASRESYRNSLGATSRTNHSLAHMVAFYSSRPDQPSLEVRVDGDQRCALMTWAFCKAMTQMGDNSTYRGLFERTLVHMTRKNRLQIPELEGDPDLLIFGTPVQAPPPYFRVLAILDSNEVILDGGSLQGLSVGRTITFHDPETRDPRQVKPLATAKVIAKGSQLTECRARLTRSLPDDQLRIAWAFPERQPAKAPSWAVHAAGTIDSLVLDRITDHLTGVGTMQWCSKEDAELLLIGRPGKVALRNPDGSPASDWIDPSTQMGLDKLASYLDAHTKGQFLRGLCTEESDCSITLNSGPPVSDGPAHEQPAPTPAARQASRRSFLSVRNTCQQSIYYTLIDIDPLNQVRVIAPAEGHLASEYRLHPGDEHSPLPVSFDLPGTRIIKLIASPEPIDLRGIFPAEGSPFTAADVERLIAPDLFWSNSSRGDSSQEKIRQKVGVSTLVLEVR